MITGSYGQATAKGVSGFQGKRGLQQTGEVDQRTWSRLTGMTRRPTRDEMYNGLPPGPAIMQGWSDGRQGPRPAGSAQAARLVFR